MFGGSKFPTFISYLTHVYGSLNAALSDTMNPKYYMSADVMLYVRACVRVVHFDGNEGQPRETLSDSPLVHAKQMANLRERTAILQIF